MRIVSQRRIEASHTDNATSPEGAFKQARCGGLLANWQMRLTSTRLFLVPVENEPYFSWRATLAGTVEVANDRPLGLLGSNPRGTRGQAL